MSSFYNDIVGKNLNRLAGLSDGIFAFAMTLLVLDLHVPARAAIHSESELWAALVVLGPRFVPYVMSFLTLGIFWVGQQAQLNVLARSNRDFAWLHLAFLLTVTLMPFSTALLAEFLLYRIVLLIYWGNIVALGGMLFASWKYAERAGLVKPEVTPAQRGALDRRIIYAQALYAFGVALCVFNTYWSIGFIVAVQLQYAIAPKFRPFSWL